MIARLLGALQFLTVWPVHTTTASPGESAIFFPVIGVLLGASAGGVLLVANHAMGESIASLLAIAWLAMVTGCLHEDGLADVADAVRVGRSREKILSILKDSRIGTYGAVALIVSIALRWQSLAVCRINPAYALVASVGLSRSALVLLGGTTSPFGGGLGSSFAASISRTALVAAALQAAVISLPAGWRYAAAMLLADAAVVLVARLWFLRRLGGINGDCLGATGQAVETINLLILACRLSF